MPDLFDEMFTAAKAPPFQPMLSPTEMFHRGIFGYSYFAHATDEDFEGLSPDLLRLAERNREPVYRASLNAYGVKSGDTLADWRKNGMVYPEDPLGWFHWYCRWSSGRRHVRDALQMRRCYDFGLRWGRYGKTQVKAKGFCSARVKQSLLHWAYEPERLLHG